MLTGCLQGNNPSLSVRPSAVRNVVRGHWAGLLSLPARWRGTTCSVWSQLQCR